MTDFASIYQNAFHPTVALQDPMDSMAKAMQMQAQQQALRDAQDFRTQYGMSPGMAEAAHKVQLGKLEEEKSKVAATADRAKAVDWLAASNSRIYESALDRIEKDPAAAPLVHQFTLKGTAQNAQQIGVDTSKSDDPTSFMPDPAKFQTSQAPFAPGQEGVPQVWDLEGQKQWLRQKIKDTTPEAVAQKRQELALKQQMEERLANAPKGEIANFAASLNKSPDDPSVIKLWGEYHPKATTNVNLAGDAWTPSKHDFSKPLPNSQSEGLAYDFADGKPQQPITSRTPQYVQDAIARGREIYKNANNGDGQGYGTNSGVLSQARKAWAPGGPQLAVANAVDVTVGHLAARDQYIEALKNHDAAALNAAANYFKTKFNLSTAPNDLRTINTLVAPEIAKVVKGSTQTNESEIQDIKQQLGDDLAAEIQKSGGQVFRGAMGTRLEVMENNYKAAYPGKSLSRILLPTTVKTFANVFNGEAPAAGGGGAPSYKGKSLPTAVFNQLSEEDKKKFTTGGGRID